MKKKLLIIIVLISFGINAKSQNFIWAKKMGGLWFDYSMDIAVDASGNVYTTGSFADTADFDPGPGVFNLTSLSFNGDMFVSKLGVSGNFIWAKHMGGASGVGGNSIVVDAAGNVYITGAFEGTIDFDPGSGIYNLTSAGYTDIFICKLNSSGNFVWAKQFAGANYYDSGYSIAVDASGNVYTTGRFTGTIDFDPGIGTYNLTTAGTYDIFISKLDASGNFILAKQLGGTSTDESMSIAIDAIGNVYTTGAFWGTSDFDPGPGIFNLTTFGALGHPDIFISKLDASGNFIWAKQMGGANNDEPRALAVDINGNVYTTGQFTGTSDFDPGTGVFNLTAGNFDVFISKLSSSGNFIWAKQIMDGFGLSIAVDAGGNVYTTGQFNGTTDFDPGPGTYNLNPTGGEVFISRLNTSGNFISAKQLGGSMAYSITADINGNVYTTGMFQDTADFDPGAGIYNLTSFGHDDIFVVKLDNTISGITENSASLNTINFYPNPSSGTFIITFSDIINEGEIAIYNLLGEKIFSEQVNNEMKKEIHLKSISDGIYFVKVFDGEKSYCKKLIIE